MNADLSIFLLIGQSNMSGRGRLEEAPPLHDPRILMFHEGQWTVAKEPLHRDKDCAGVGLGMSFALEIINRGCAQRVGLVPCAVGGTPLRRWMPGRDLYEQAVSAARTAIAAGALRGILWHQGEADSGSVEKASSYGSRFAEMINRMRADLSCPNVPVVAGGLGDFLKDYKGCDFFAEINRQLNALEGKVPFYACASSRGLADNGDKLHFNAASLREFGRRYAAKYMEMANTSC